MVFFCWWSRLRSFATALQRWSGSCAQMVALLNPTLSCSLQIHRKLDRISHLISRVLTTMVRTAGSAQVALWAEYVHTCPDKMVARQFGNDEFISIQY